MNAAPTIPDAHGSRPTDADGRSVLSTLNDDGSRRWLKPRVSKGRFLTARRATAYFLIALFAALPLIHVGGRPLVLLDIVARRFHLFGSTFYPTDTLLLALLVVTIFLTIFWITALLGRVWCGWACPQTVYMEFLFRPIERLIEGAPGRAAKGRLQRSPFARPVRLLISLACSFVLAHLFLSYFVSWDNLRHWVFGSPGDHIIGFGVVAFVTIAMMLDFGYFREQVCLVMCPYGRFQSVLLDRHSMIIRYDERRGEPRKAPARAVSLPVLTDTPAQASGDCIDCKLCVTTCPTGIDIRKGLQMECIGCAQCIDACDTVMDKIDRPRGLIRYSSQAAMEGQRFRMMRPRVLLYPAVMAILIGLFTFVLVNTGLADVTALRGFGQPFTVAADGSVLNGVRIKIVNRLDRPAEFTLAVSGLPGATLRTELPVVRVAPGQMLTTPAQIIVPRSAFHHARATATIEVRGPEGFKQSIPFTLLGPAGDEHPHEPHHDDDKDSTP